MRIPWKCAFKISYKTAHLVELDGMHETKSCRATLSVDNCEFRGPTIFAGKSRHWASECHKKT